MSDEEENYEEEDEEIEAEEAPPPEEEEKEVEAEAEPEPEPEPEPEEEEEAPPPKPQEKPKPRPKPMPSMDEGETISEAEQAMLAAKKKHAEEEEAKLVEFEKTREIERQKQEEELEALKEKQSKRREERQEMEAEMAAQKAAQDEATKRDEEVKQARLEAAKAKKDMQKKKKEQMMEGSMLASDKGKGRNFVVVKKEKSELPGEEGKPVKKGLSKDEYDELKKQFMINACRPLELHSRDVHGLRDLIKTMHKRLENLETKKYDLEKRHGLQDYDVRELNERRKQSERAKALSKGLDPEEAVNSPHPPKIQVSSKFDRQIDRRPYVERRNIYQKPKTRPVKKLCHGTARPPPEFGRPAATIEELELLRKNMEPPKYVEDVHMEGAKPPVKPKPLQVPGEDDVEEPPAPPPAEVAAEE